MPELHRNHLAPGARDLASREEPISMAECELRAFLNKACELAGPDARGNLTELWLDELASLECMPEPSSSGWRLVSEAAMKKLAKQLVERQLVERGLTPTGIHRDGSEPAPSGANMIPAKEDKLEALIFLASFRCRR